MDIYLNDMETPALTNSNFRAKVASWKDARLWVSHNVKPGDRIEFYYDNFQVWVVDRRTPIVRRRVLTFLMPCGVGKRGHGAAGRSAAAHRPAFQRGRRGGVEGRPRATGQLKQRERERGVMRLVDLGVVVPFVCLVMLTVLSATAL